jgi:anti-sigma regulatory factor (Ser/Thr protein kinase)
MLPSDEELVDLIRTAVRTFVGRLPEGDAIAAQVELPVVETFINAVVHAHAGRVELAIEIELVHDPPYLIAHVHDRGSPLDPPGHPPSERTDRERSFELIRQMADRFSVASRPSGNTVSLTWKLDVSS